MTNLPGVDGRLTSVEKPPPDYHPCTAAIFAMLTHGPSYRALNRPALGGTL
ncbi:hypothetical protein ACH4VM_35370 [Streptomyces sp. NPDC020792]|uniref:hypothetical protein n=1 Tax=Streptomyces sp. NPDC020792 TaxID=3365089 RepID=UPI0037AF7331